MLLRKACPWEQDPGAIWFPLPMVAVRAVTLCEAEWVSKDKLGSMGGFNSWSQIPSCLAFIFWQK